MRSQSQTEEFWNSITHGVGFLLSLAGFVILITFKSFDTILSTVAIVLYGVALSVLYFVSTLYHFEKNERRKNIYRKLDHISIYYLIAGTYSPVVLIALEHSLGWVLFWIVWGIALIGTLLKIFFTGKFEIVSVLLYLIMGWLIVFDFPALKASVDTTSIYLLIGGGLAYTVGIIFYAMDRIQYSHVIWHLFVLCGSILHYVFILRIIT